MKKKIKKIAGWTILITFGFVPFYGLLKPGTDVQEGFCAYLLVLAIFGSIVKALMWIFEE